MISLTPFLTVSVTPFNSVSLTSSSSTALVSKIDQDTSIDGSPTVSTRSRMCFSLSSIARRNHTFDISRSSASCVAQYASSVISSNKSAPIAFSRLMISSRKDLCANNHFWMSFLYTRSIASHDCVTAFQCRSLTSFVYVGFAFSRNATGVLSSLRNAIDVAVNSCGSPITGSLTPLDTGTNPIGNHATSPQATGSSPLRSSTLLIVPMPAIKSSRSSFRFFTSSSCSSAISDRSKRPSISRPYRLKNSVSSFCSKNRNRGINVKFQNPFIWSLVSSPDNVAGLSVIPASTAGIPYLANTVSRLHFFIVKYSMSAGVIWICWYFTPWPMTDTVCAFCAPL